jgi:predicted permease
MGTLLGTGALVRFAMPAASLRILAPMRNATFNYFLPALVLRSMWSVHIDHSMFLVAFCSLLCHAAVMCLWQLLLVGVEDRPTKGFYILALQGCMLSFLYSGIGEHPRFGKEATAVCLMWDMGGNFWVSQALCFAVGSMYGPHKLKLNDCTDPEALEQADGPTISSNHTDDEGGRSDGMGFDASFSVTKPTGKALLTVVSPRAGAKIGEIIKVVLFTPLLQSFVIGVVLNFTGLPAPFYLGEFLDIVGSLFRPSLYFVLGLLLSFDLLGDASAVRMVLGALALRFFFMGALALFAWKVMRFDRITRATVSLALLSPSSSTSVFVMSKYNYSEKFEAMMSLTLTLSVLIAFVTHSVLIAMF